MKPGSLKRIAKLAFCCAVLLVLPGVWLGSEILYAKRIRPSGIRTAADHFKRFGEPRYVYEVQNSVNAATGTGNGDRTCYEFTGFSPSAPPLLAVPSSPPAYVYDQNGAFIDWCDDPGDRPWYRQTWHRVSNEPLDKNTVRSLLNSP